MVRKNVPVVFATAIILAVLAGCASFRGDIPVAAELPEVTYISPANRDGIQDSLILPVDIPAVEGLVVAGYRLSIMDEGGEPFRVIEDVREKPRKGLFGRIKEGIKIPDELEWDGTSDDGEYVEDGRYSYDLTAWDYNNNRGRTVPLYVIVDNTPPGLELSAPYLFFSPNGDGRQDLLLVNQRFPTEETEWSGNILDTAGNTLKQLSWQGKAADFSWDGTNEEGQLNPDGEYTYRVISTDLAGNTGSFELAGIIIDTEPTPIKLDTNPAVFSPNGDGKKDIIRFLPALERTNNVVSWEIAIVDETGNIRRSFTGKESAPGPLDFDGKVASGQVLRDGRYFSLMSVLYRNGDSPQIASPFSVDNTPPLVTLSADNPLFSPDGDGRKDTVTIFQSSSMEDAWEGSISDETGKTVLQRTWKGRAVFFNWNGLDGAGKAVPDGTYTYRITSRDGADNTTTAELKGIVVDTRPTPVTVTASPESFSPNGSGISELVNFKVGLTVPTGIKTWSFFITDGKERILRRFSGEGTRVPTAFVWNGKAEDGSVTEGSYYGVFEAQYLKGNLVESKSPRPVLLDLSPPVTALNISPTPFSPDNDGLDDTVTITANLKDDNPIESWSAAVLDPAGNAFITFAGNGAPQKPIVWNGRSKSGELVQSASDYLVQFTARDVLGNQGTTEAAIGVDILVLRIGDQLRIIISSIYFKPYTADFVSIEPEKVQQNLKTLDRLAEILKKFSQYRIRIEGHAVREYWNVPGRIQKEEDEELKPLSSARAEVIKQALIDRGIANDRMTTFGLGGTQPVVPHGDLDNRWKNRRVEFLLIK